MLKIPLINCEVYIILTWSKNCVLTDMTIHAAVPAQEDNPARAAINALTPPSFSVAGTKLYVPVIILSIEDDNELLQQLKTGFERTIKWQRYRLEISNSKIAI